MSLDSPFNHVDEVENAAHALVNPYYFHTAEDMENKSFGQGFLDELRSAEKSIVEFGKNLPDSDAWNKMIKGLNTKFQQDASDGMQGPGSPVIQVLDDGSLQIASSGYDNREIKVTPDGKTHIKIESR